MENLRNRQTLPITIDPAEDKYQKPETPPPTYEEACVLRDTVSSLANQPLQLSSVTHVQPHNDLVESKDTTNSTTSRDQLIVCLPQTQHCNHRLVAASRVEGLPAEFSRSASRFTQPSNLPYDIDEGDEFGFIVTNGFVMNLCFYTCIILWVITIIVLIFFKSYWL